MMPKLIKNIPPIEWSVHNVNVFANVTKMIGQKKQRGDALPKRAQHMVQKCLNGSSCNLILCEGGRDSRPKLSPNVKKL